MLSGLPQAWACPWLNGENPETASEFNQAAKRGKGTMHGVNAFRWDRLHSSFELKIWRLFLCVSLGFFGFCFAVKPVTPRCSVPTSVPVGKSAELTCVEDEGFPKSHYQWFHNKEEIPVDPKSSPKFSNSSYMLNGEIGVLVSSGRNGRRDILGSQMMCDCSSHEGNLLYSLALFRSATLTGPPWSLNLPSAL